GAVRPADDEPRGGRPDVRHAAVWQRQQRHGGRVLGRPARPVCPGMGLVRDGALRGRPARSLARALKLSAFTPNARRLREGTPDLPGTTRCARRQPLQPEPTTWRAGLRRLRTY